MKALISIDYTNDFVATKGALTTGVAGQAIEEAIVAVTKAFTQNKDFVVYAIDRHDQNDPYHPENALFPPHNLANSSGRNLYGKLAEVYEKSRENANVYWITILYPKLYASTAVCNTQISVQTPTK